MEASFLLSRNGVWHEHREEDDDKKKKEKSYKKDKPYKKKAYGESHIVNE
jgi:hypothetical protein